MNFTSVDRKRIAKINSAQYIKLKLHIAYAAFFLLFICLGAAVSYLFKRITPPVIINDMISFFTPTMSEGKIINVISSIIYNSIDIFKISIIIIISGFSYISRAISRTTAAIWSTWCGSAFFHYVTTTNRTVSGEAIILAGIVIALYCAIFISNCVNAELMAQEFCAHHTSGIIFSSNHFWRYIGIFLISFGYILIIYTVYTCLFKLLK